MDEPATTRRDAAGTPSRLPGALLVHAARVIALGLQSTCISAGDRVGWSTSGRPDDGTDLYSGGLGIAVFLAAYARADGSAWARDLALRAAAPARRSRGDHPPGLGGLVGRGAQIYGLAILGRLLDEPALLADAHRLAASIDARWIEADRSLDVVHGSAGLILALLGLGSTIGEPAELLGHVRTASTHLIAMQRPPGAPWAGAVLGDDSALPQSGFAHGATGVSVALARAGRALGDDSLFAAAASALACERTYLAVGPGRWRPVPGDPRTPIGWCRGAPGAALGRRAVLEASRGRFDDDGAIAREIAEATGFMQQFPAIPLDHLCCGGMSVADALLVLSQDDDSSALADAAHERAVWILRAARKRGHFVTGTEDPGEPSLFQGLAGVGYGFLRLADPALPCLSIMDPGYGDLQMDPLGGRRAR